MNPKDNWLYCPNCKWPNEVSIVDKFHPNVSTTKPKESEVYEDIVNIPKECRNPNCKIKFPVYYFRKKPKAKKPGFLLH